jgi:GDP/UDP-N,N'-diacetylbacillosamine 2-epimerase (hydrolysing)
MRRICYLTGTRADYGLMRRTLNAIDAHPDLSLDLIVTGMHLDPRHGHTVSEIKAGGLTIAGEIPVRLSEDDESFMARAIARTIEGCCDIFERERPDLMLLLGDRGEMLAGAIAAIHLNIPVVHIHGGERSGTVDEPVRHAISKLSHYHFTATEEAAERLRRMGEDPKSIFVVGAPGLVSLTRDRVASKADCLAAAGWTNDQPFALLVFHPVVQRAAEGADEMRELLAALRRAGLRIVALQPNADLGANAIRAVLEEEKEAGDLALFTHLERDMFVSMMAHADVMIGNSSAGIIEAASFGTPVVNVGSRQQLRERSENVIDVEADPGSLDAALAEVRTRGRLAGANVYGDGRAAERIADLLATLPVTRSVLEKCCAY